MSKLWNLGGQTKRKKEKEDTNTHCYWLSQYNIKCKDVFCEVKCVKGYLGSCRYVEIFTTETSYDEKSSGGTIILVYVHILFFVEALKVSLSTHIR